MPDSVIKGFENGHDKTILMIPYNTYMYTSYKLTLLINITIICSYIEGGTIVSKVDREGKKRERK